MKNRIVSQVLSAVMAPLLLAVMTGMPCLGREYRIESQEEFDAVHEVAYHDARFPGSDILPEPPNPDNQ